MPGCMWTGMGDRVTTDQCTMGNQTDTKGRVKKKEIREFSLRGGVATPIP